MAAWATAIMQPDEADALASVHDAVHFENGLNTDPSAGSSNTANAQIDTMVACARPLFSACMSRERTITVAVTYCVRMERAQQALAAA